MASIGVWTGDLSLVETSGVLSMALSQDGDLAMTEVDIGEVVQQAMRVMAAQGEDTFNRKVAVDLERDELAAWDSFAHAWMAFPPPSAAPA